MDQREKRVTPKEAARILGVSPVTIGRYRRAGVLPAIKLSERCVRFRVRDLMDFEAKHYSGAMDAIEEGQA